MYARSVVCILIFVLEGENTQQFEPVPTAETARFVSRAREVPEPCAPKVTPLRLLLPASEILTVQFPTFAVNLMTIGAVDGH